MCGRTACTLAPDELCKACKNKSFDVEWRDHPGSQHNYFPSYNVAPTAHTPVIFSGKHLKNLSNEEAESEFVMQPMMWNLIPHFYKGDSAKSHGYKTNNCRVESVEQKQMFSYLLKKGQRCVVLCDGFYEWHTQDKSKTPYLIYAPQPSHVQIWDRSSWDTTVKKQKQEDLPEKEKELKETTLSSDKEEQDNGLHEAVRKGQQNSEEGRTDWNGPVPLKMAGLFSKWKSTDGEEVWSYTVLTTEAGKGFSWLHHRVPVILGSQQMVKDWLDPDTPYSKTLNNINGSPDVKWHAVSDQVNNSRNNSVTCMEPAQTNTKKPLNKMMSSWLVKSNKRHGTDEASELPDNGKQTLKAKRKSSEDSEELDTSKKVKLNSSGE
uniref:Abasic site processing protein HMCES n=1 Tax=Hirondellea gigas TaxID=1518452 RepID=A0A6A7G7L5_9CRUS